MGRADVGGLADAEHLAQRGQGGQFAAAAVHAGDRRGGRGAQVETADSGAVRVPADGRAEHGLPHALPADRDVAADVVRVVRLLGGRGLDRPGQDEIAESGREPLDLRLDPAGDVHVRSGGHVGVGPQRLAARRSPGRIGHAGLDDQHVRVLRVPARGHLGLGGGHLLIRPAQVQGAGPAAVLVGPGHRPGQGEVDLADAGVVAEPAQRGPVPAGQPVTGQLGQRFRRDVQQHGPGGRQLGQGADPAAGLDGAAGGQHRLGHRVGDPGAAAGHHRPAHPVREQDQHEPDAAGRDGGERQHGMGSGAGQDGAGLLAAPAPDQGRDGQDAAGAVPGHDQRVRGRAAQRLEQGGADVIGMPGQRAHQPPVGTAVGAQAGGGLRHRAEHQRRAAAVERVGELDLRPGQLHAPCGQVEALEEWRRLGQRVRGGADVVPEPRQGQLLGPAAAADDLRTLDDVHVQARRS